MRLSGTPIKYKVPSSAQGRYTDEILSGLLKKSDTEIAKLKDGGVV